MAMGSHSGIEKGVESYSTTVLVLGSKCLRSLDGRGSGFGEVPLRNERVPSSATPLQKRKKTLGSLRRPSFALLLSHKRNKCPRCFLAPPPLRHPLNSPTQPGGPRGPQ